MSEPSNDVLSAKLDFIKDLLLEKLTHADKRIDSLAADMDTKVNRSEFKPVQALVFGCAGLILTAVIGALIALVVVGH